MGNAIDYQIDDYLLEKTLKEKDVNLHQRFKDIVFISQRILTKYKQLFPEYTDHSEFHTMTIIDSCNKLIGQEQIKKLNVDEIYILLVGCYLHDVGMGINEKDYDSLRVKLNEKAFFDKNPEAKRTDFVRTYHHELSGFFVEKYAEMLDIPSKEHAFAIRQIVRGHRKVDLYDENEYPSAYKLPNGNTVCLPYLAALVRLSDEIDVVATRNPLVLYETEYVTSETQMLENKKLYAVKAMNMTEDEFVFLYETDEEKTKEGLKEMRDKMQQTLDYCRDVVEKRTNFVLTQKKVIMKEMEH